MVPKVTSKMLIGIVVLFLVYNMFIGLEEINMDFVSTFLYWLSD